MDQLKISQELIRQIIDHAREKAPFEVCGMIGGLDDTVKRVYPTSNPDASSLTYTIDSKEAFSVIRQMREDGVEFIAVYHSHPATEAYPSPTDIAKAGDSDLIYMIASLADSKRPDVRAFLIKEGQVSELKVISND